MDLTVLIIICVLYGMVMFFDFFFKSCMMLPYIEFLQTSGITVKFFRLQFHTNAFNRFINRFSSKMPTLYKKSFKLGFYVTMFLFPVAISLMMISLFTTGSSVDSSEMISQSSGKKEESTHLEILLPGVNLPLNQIGYYIIALLVCSVVHEAGHGIAAVLEDIPVSGFGMHLFFILPIAYTQIDTDSVQSARLWKKLKIFSAGIWNNLLLAAFCYIILLLLPIFLYPMYKTNDAIFITKIKLNAPIVGEKGLYVGDSLYEINGCQVNNENDFYQCLQETLTHHPSYCVKEEFVHENDESIHEIEHRRDGVVNCCPPSNPSLNCFENYDEERLPQYVCLEIRHSLEHSKNYCHKGRSCPEHMSCIKAVLPNTTTIIHIKRRNRSIDFIYYGHPMDIIYNVEVSDYIPKTKVFEPWFADAISLMLKYLIVFSSGLAVINVIPSYGLDGQFLMNTILNDCLPSKYFSKAKKEAISMSVNLSGSILLLLSVIKILWMTFT